LFIGVGGSETGGFHIQHRTIAEKWKGNLAEDIPCPGENHFTVLDNLHRPDGSLFNGTLRMMGIQRA